MTLQLSHRRLRPISAKMTSADLPNVLALAQALGDVRHLSLAELRHCTLGDPTCSPDLLLLARVNGDLVGFCFACIREGRGIIKLFGVSQAHRRKGVGTALFDEIESRLRSRGIREVAAEGLGPNYFLPGVELSHTETVCFLLGRGYQTDRKSRVDMEVDLERTDLDTSQAEERLRAEGILLRRAHPGEVPDVAQFALDNFSATWQGEVARSADLSPTPLFIALQGKRIIGFAAHDVGGTARFGPMGTLADLRGRGIGSALLKMCLRSIRDNGYDRAEIGWVGPIGFYARAVNARIHRVYWLFHKSLVD